MVAQQEAIVGENNMDNVKNMLMIVNKKGKRTKRARPLSPLALTMSTSTATTVTQESGSVSNEWGAASTTEEEEEDMAHCLILLAQGGNDKNKGGGIVSYECKTCYKSFQSFQALGGHRASHGKGKGIIVTESEIQDQFDSNNNVDLTLQMANYYMPSTINTAIVAGAGVGGNSNNVITKVKVHECSICKATFSSGQALGGHMRRHRPIGTATKVAIPEEKTKRNLFSLDLNLPAPEEEYVHQHRNNFVFPTNDKTLVFNASSLVDCHY